MMYVFPSLVYSRPTAAGVSPVQDQCVIGSVVDLVKLLLKALLFHEHGFPDVRTFRQQPVRDFHGVCHLTVPWKGIPGDGDFSDC